MGANRSRNVWSRPLFCQSGICSSVNIAQCSTALLVGKNASVVHVCIISVQFDAGPEGICTGRLIRALLASGFRVTLLTSTKARTKFQHPNLRFQVFSYQPREPRLLIRWLAQLRSDFPHNFYFWGRRVAAYQFSDNDLPDIFYGRAWPISSLIPADELAHRYNKPLISHLSDPVPPPNEGEASQETLELLQRLVRHSAFVTFTNEQTIRYQQQFLELDGKARLLPHVAPDPITIEPQRDHSRFSYIGAIGEREQELKLLLRAFSAFADSRPGAQLNFTTDRPAWVAGAKRELALAELPVHASSYAPSFEQAVKSAGTLVSVEPWVETPVWTLTKTIEYLFTNRKILAIASPGSVTEELMRRFPESCVIVTEYTTSAVISGLEQITRLRPGERHFQERVEAMESFHGDSVARRFQQLCEQALG